MLLISKVNKIMINKMFTIASFVIAIIFWFFESSIHYFIHEEPQFEIIPNDLNEIWMRVVIVLLIILFGILSDSITHKIIYKQLEVVRVYDSMIHTSNNILNNLLNQMQLFKDEALKSKDFDRDVIKLYDNSLKQASDLVDTFSNIKDMSQQHIESDKKGGGDK